MSVRFTGFRAPDGLLVLDGESGEVVLIPDDGGPPVLRREAAGLALAKPAGAPALVDSVAPSELEREVLATYPLPIARAFARYLKEPDPRQKCKLLVDTFATVLKLWALQIASEYLRADGLYDAHVQELLTRDLQRPLISAWASMVHRGLVALRAGGRPLFAPELADAFDRLELKCEQPIAVRVRYEDEEGSPKYKQSKLGRIQALIRYRNSLAHGFDQSIEKARADLAMYGPVLTDLLERARFMARRPLVLLRPTRDREGAEGSRLMGQHARPDPQRFAGILLPERGGPVYLLDEGRRELLPLHHFVDVSQREDRSLDVLLFDGSTRSTVVYVSADGEHVEKQVRAREIRDLTGGKAQRDESGSSPRELTLEALGAAAARSVTRVLSALERSGRFLPEASIPRHALEAQLEFFFTRDYRAFVVTGEGGTGKTTLLCRVAKERMDRGDVVAMVPAFSLVDADPVRRFTSDLGLRIPYFEELLAALDPIFRREPARRLVLLVDAINEHRDPAALVRAIDNAVAQTADYPWLRIVASVRASVYERLPPDARFGLAPGASYFLVEETRGTERRRTPLVPLGAFDDEEVLAACSAYRALRLRDPDDPVAEPIARFRPLSGIEELDPDGSTRRLLRHPLLMRLVLAAHNRRPLPANLAPDRAVELFWDEVVIERNADRGHPERGVFLRALVRELDRASADSVARDRLYANELLKPALMNPQHDSPFVQLLDLGILTEDWSGEECRVRFAHAEMFEFLLAELHEARVETGADVRRLLERSRELRSLRTAALMLLRRSAEAGVGHLLVDSLDDGSTDAAELVRDVAIELARLGSPAFEPTVRELTRAPLVLVAVFDALFLMGASAQAEHVLGALERLAIEDPRVQLGLELRRGRAEHRRGDARKAAETLEGASALARRCEAELDACRIDVLRAMLAFERNDLELASALCAGVEAALLAGGALSELSEARRIQGLIADRRGDRERARACVEEAIELATRVDDRVNMAKAHNNVAAFFAAASVFEEAEHHFLEARALHEAAGARVSAAIADHNLAGLYFRAMHDLDRSRAAYARAERTFAAAKHARGEAAALTSLAAVELCAGRPGEAIPLLERALVLWEGASDAANTAYARYLRAMAGIEAGSPFAEIEEEIARHRELATKLDTPPARLHLAVLELRASVRADAGALPSVDELERRLTALRGECQVEDGAAFALVDVAARARELGRAGLAWQWAERALALAGEAPFPLRSAAESIVIGSGAGAPAKPS